MKRSAGVTASGVIAILGSLVTILFGIITAVSSFAMRANPIPQRPDLPFNPVVILIGESVILCGFGIFGIVSSIGLLRLKNWARISFIVFGVLLGLMCVMSLIGTSIAMLMVPQIMAQQAQGPPPGFLTGVFAVFMVFELVLAGLAAWWIYFFNRRVVKEQFLTGAEASAPRRGPLSITIIAWLLAIGGGLGVLVGLFMSFPLFLFGFVFSGWVARLVTILYSSANLLAGVGLLRWRPQAHTLAMAIYGFGLLSTIASVILPGSMARMLGAMQQVGYPPDANFPVFNGPFLWMGMVFAVIGVGVPLFFLVTRRQAFMEACQQQSL